MDICGFLGCIWLSRSLDGRASCATVLRLMPVSRTIWPNRDTSSEDLISDARPLRYVAVLVPWSCSSARAS